MRWIGLHLSFEEEVIHRIPHGLPSHRLCGAHALAFIAHVLLDVDLLDSLEELDTMRVNMRASFVQAMHEGHTCICPIVWGEGGRGALIKSLPDELCTHGVPTHTCLSSEPRRPSRPLEATNCSKPCNRSSHGNNWKLLPIMWTSSLFSLLNLLLQSHRTRGRQLERNLPKIVCPLAWHLPLNLTLPSLRCLKVRFLHISKWWSSWLRIRLDRWAVVSSLWPFKKLSLFWKLDKLFPKSLKPLLFSIALTMDFSLCCLPLAWLFLVAAQLWTCLGWSFACPDWNGVVEKYGGSNLVSLESPDVRTIRVSVLRDEEDDWEGFARAPIRSLVGLFPELWSDVWPKVVHAQGGTMMRTSPSGNQSLTSGGTNSWSLDSDQWPIEASSIPACLLVRILSRSGSAGAYVEPRTADGQQALQEYMVIWASMWNKQIKSGSYWIGSDQCATRSAGPCWPSAWCSPTGSTSLQLPNLGEGPRWNPDLKAQAWRWKWQNSSAATLALCGGTSSKEDDPWAKNDPRRSFQPSTARACPVPASESLHQLESRMQASVIAKLPQAMEQDNLPERLGVFPSAIPKGCIASCPRSMRSHSNCMARLSRRTRASRLCSKHTFLISVDSWRSYHVKTVNDGVGGG